MLHKNYKKGLVMRYLTCLVVFLFVIQAKAATAPSTWPPAWASTQNGGALGSSDNHAGADYGIDTWGYWANLDLLDGATVLASIEMRYIEPGEFHIGAYPGEAGFRVYERRPSAKVVGSTGYWVSALECPQQLWEESHKLSDASFSMRLKQWGDSDIADLMTASFPADASAYTKPVNASDYPTLLDKKGDNINDWQNAVNAAFRASFDTHKAYRAIESQTFASCRDFCANTLLTQVQSQPGGASVRSIRLPTEYEWEYICRAGTTAAYWFGPTTIGHSVDFTMKNLTVTKSDFLFPFDSEYIRDHIHDALGGDGGLHREWFTQGSKNLKVVKVTLDGVGTASGNLNKATSKDLAGTVTLSGDLVAIPVEINFDERYQDFYVENKYGSHTPVLMTYTFDGTEYQQAPYAVAPAAGVFYKAFGRDAYFDSSAMAIGDTATSTKFRDVVGELVDATSIPGDFYLGEQLEYVEMVPVAQKVDATGAFDANGQYVLDSVGNPQPIRTLYTPASYYLSGKYIGSTFPDMERGSQSNEDFARNADLSDNPKEEMTVEDYIATFKQEVQSQLRGKVVELGPWYSGKRDYDVTYVDIEIDENGIPIEVNKTKTVTITKIIPETYHGVWEEDITINATIKSGITAITPDDQKRNPFGLYNTHGNVAEWVDTAWDGRSDYGNHVDGPLQITRGGSWKTGAQFCRSAARVGRDPGQAYDDVGFRFILED